MEKEKLGLSSKLRGFGVNNTTEDILGINELKSKSTKIIKIDIDKLRPYKNHLFKLYEGERFNDMVQSIKEFGVINPIIVTSIEDTTDEYMILAGHNRTNAAKAAGLKDMPSIVKEGLTEEEAFLIVTETNLMQRSFSEMLHSEKAAVLAQHNKALKSQGKKKELIREIEEIMASESELPDRENREQTPAITGTRAIGKAYELSKATVARYLRIDTLIRTIKDRIDTEEISIRAGVELSYLSKEKQEIIEKHLAETSIKLDIKSAAELRKNADRMTEENIKELLNEGRIKKEVTNIKIKPIKIKSDIITKYFSEEQKQEEIERIIESALQEYFNKTESVSNGDRI